LPRWMKRSVAERLARGSDALTLFVPEKSSGFVSTKDGSMKLNRILVPIDHEPSPRAAIEYARRATALAAGGAEVIVLHVGRGDAPKVDIPDDGKWMMIHQEGNIVDVIVDRAREYRVDLIIMTTAGHEGFLDAMRGSVTEQVLRKASRPLLAVPASSFIK